MIRVAAPDVKALAARLGNLSKVPARDFKRIMSSTRRGTFTATKRAAVDQYGVNQKRVAQDVRVSDVQGNPPAFVITGDRKPISLMNYGAKGLAGMGYTVIVKRARGRSRLEMAFAARSNGASLLWQRSGKFRVMSKGRYKGKFREAIEPLFGPSVADMLRNKQVVDRIEVFALTKMSSELERTINRILRGRG